VINPMQNRKIAKRVANAYVSGTRVKKASKRYNQSESLEGRDIPYDYKFNPKAKKPLAKVLWSTSCALGHLVSAYSLFTKTKSVSISPDGKLGGKGYIQDLREMRTALNGAIETVSAIQDTINDELRAAHWDHAVKSAPKAERKEVEEMLSDSEDIMDDPEDFVEKEYKKHITDDIEGESTEESDEDIEDDEEE
jgi:hypothetical protein